MTISSSLNNAEDSGDNSHPQTKKTRFVVTGNAAHERIVPLLPRNWIDCTHSITQSETNEIDFLWENTPRICTRKYRDQVKCYSHLPNGSALLDSKWALARLMMDYDCDESNDFFAALETHCFCGPSGFENFAKQVGLSSFSSTNNEIGSHLSGREGNENKIDSKIESSCSQDLKHKTETDYSFLDLCSEKNFTYDDYSWKDLPPTPSNLWVLKDSNSNGAGGIWILSPTNYHYFSNKNNNTPSIKSSLLSPILENRHYVAQKYAWPPVLYEGKKCHVRVYALMTSDGKAYVHRRAFLHVANEKFDFNTSLYKNNDDNNSANEKDLQYEATVHITNCCANSHDKSKFAGEICAHFQESSYNRCFEDKFKKSINKECDDSISLSPFFPSICASVHALAKSSFPFLQGGESHSGFEYLGLDFILSYKPSTNAPESSLSLQPTAYLLEVNAPPSQDTATGLKHAELLHDEVIRDLLTLWVYPRISGNEVNPGGWHCVFDKDKNGVKSNINEKVSVFPIDQDKQYQNVKDKSSGETSIRPSKAAILNKVRWALYERKMAKLIECREPQLHRKEEKDKKEKLLPTPSDEITDSKNQSHIQVASDQINIFARSQFSYFNKDLLRDNTISTHADSIFFENAGGAQVPFSVIEATQISLANRHRDVIGSYSKASARQTLLSILGANNDDHHNDDLNTFTQSVSDHNTEIVVDPKTNDEDDSLKIDEKHECFHNPVPPIGASKTHTLFLGANASTLLHTLAKKYIDSGLLSSQDEIVIAEHNHDANIIPWLQVAKATGATVKWWKCCTNSKKTNVSRSTTTTLSLDMQVKYHLDQVLSNRTKIVAMAHASNVLGQLYDIEKICQHIHLMTSGNARVVVDGVAAVPHRFANVKKATVDWYVISCHKLFGPHIGALCGRNEAILEIEYVEKNKQKKLMVDGNGTDPYQLERNKSKKNYDCELWYKEWEVGTINYEACAGANALGQYFQSLALISSISEEKSSQDLVQSPVTMTLSTDKNKCQPISRYHVLKAYKNIETAENPLVHLLITSLDRCNHVEIIQENCVEPLKNRLPIVCFFHQKIKSSFIMDHCMKHNIIGRCGFFLAHRLLGTFGVGKMRDEVQATDSDGVVRFSMAHYNTKEEVTFLIKILESMENWF